MILQKHIYANKTILFKNCILRLAELLQSFQSFLTSSKIFADKTSNIYFTFIKNNGVIFFIFCCTIFQAWKCYQLLYFNRFIEIPDGVVSSNGHLNNGIWLTPCGFSENFREIPCNNGCNGRTGCNTGCMKLSFWKSSPHPQPEPQPQPELCQICQVSPSHSL